MSLNKFDTVAGVTSASAATGAALTDNSGGTASTTLADVTEAQNAGSADRVPTENAIASLAAQIEANRVDIAAIISTLNTLIAALNKAN